MKSLILGQVLTLTADPFHTAPEASFLHLPRGGVLIEDGHVLAVDEADALRAAHPDAAVEDMGARLLLPGFIDCHVHYPQTAIIGAWGKRLIDWLNGYTFPEELRFADPAYAAAQAETFLDLLAMNGTTTACVYCTVHPESAEAFFTAAEARGLRMTAGKVMMDRNAPAGLTDTPETGAAETRALIEKWHGRGRLQVAITPRFAPTSTPEQLAAAGALRAEFPDCPVQTHLSEQPDEIAWVADLYPEAPDYLGVYEAHGLSGKGAIMGHAIHLTERERAAMAAEGVAVGHCPTSNTFIGSGLCDVAGLKAQGIPVGLATDTGGGSSFSMLVTMRAAYEISQLRHSPMHPAQLLWLATAGSAEAMGIADKVGRLAPGMEADLIALDPKGTPALQARRDDGTDPWHSIFGAIILGDERCIAGVWSGGRRLR